MDVLQRIKDLMELHHWSKYILAKQSNVDTPTINNMFQCNSIPTIPTIEKIAAAFGLTLSQFFAEDEEPYPLTPEQRAVVEAWSFLTPTQRELTLNLMLNMNRPPEK